MDGKGFDRFLHPPRVMTTPKPLTDEQIKVRVTNLLVDSQDLTEKAIATLTTWRDTPAVRDNLKSAVLGIFQAVDERRAQILRKEQQDQALKDRALKAKDKILAGDLSGILPQDLPAIAAGLTPEEMQNSLWLILAGVALAQREEQRMNLAEM